MREIIEPANEAAWHALRAKDLTSTDVGAMFGVSPYLTEFELYHRKRDGVTVPFEPSEVIRWGQRLQDAIAAGVAEDEKWTTRKMTEYIRLPDARLGSSFDFAIGDDGILEIKNVFGLKFRDEWVIDDAGEVEAPPHIEIQVQHQMLVSGRKWAVIAALVSGNKIVTIRREAVPAIHDAILARAKRFWSDVEGGHAPKPDFGRDADFISSLYGYAEPGKVVPADGRMVELAKQYRELSETAKVATASRDAVKAELLTLMGDAEKVQGDGFSITAGVVGPARIEYDREAYRNFRINWKKVKP